MNLCWVYQGGACNASRRPCPWVNGSTLIHHGWVAKKKIGSKKISIFFLVKGLTSLMERVFLERGDCWSNRKPTCTSYAIFHVYNGTNKKFTLETLYVTLTAVLSVSPPMQQEILLAFSIIRIASSRKKIVPTKQTNWKYNRTILTVSYRSSTLF